MMQTATTPHWVAVLLGLLGASGTLHAESLAESPAAYVLRMDLDGDRRVSLAEYQDYLSRGFQQMDRNADGRLSVDELPPGTRARRAPTIESHRRALAASFDRQDRDNNGFLDAPELAAPPR